MSDSTPLPRLLVVPASGPAFKVQGTSRFECEQIARRACELRSIDFATCTITELEPR